MSDSNSDRLDRFFLLGSVLVKFDRVKDFFDWIKKRDKIDKLSKRDGIWFEGDLCLRKASLETCVRQQPGFRNWKLSTITDELVRMNALCVQEEGTRQVKLCKDNGVPRVYRIKMDILREFAEKY